jgi:hypothetical protein
MADDSKTNDKPKFTKWFGESGKEWLAHGCLAYVLSLEEKKKVLVSDGVAELFWNEKDKPYSVATEQHRKQESGLEAKGWRSDIVLDFTDEPMPRPKSKTIEVKVGSDLTSNQRDNIADIDFLVVPDKRKDVFLKNNKEVQGTIDSGTKPPIITWREIKERTGVLLNSVKSTAKYAEVINLEFCMKVFDESDQAGGWSIDSIRFQDDAKSQLENYATSDKSNCWTDIDKFLCGLATALRNSDLNLHVYKGWSNSRMQKQAGNHYIGFKFKHEDANKEYWIGFQFDAQTALNEPSKLILKNGKTVPKKETFRFHCTDNANDGTVWPLTGPQENKTNLDIFTELGALIKLNDGTIKITNRQDPSSAQDS